MTQAAISATSGYRQRGLAYRVLKLDPARRLGPPVAPVVDDRPELARMGGVVVGIAAAMLVLGPGWRLLLAVTHFVLYAFVLALSINGLGHWWSRKKFGNNSATNLPVLAWLTGGESPHNNHDAYPSSPSSAWAASSSIPRAW